MQFKDNQGLVPPRASDPGWAHGIMVNGGRQKIKCKYCHKVMLGGGISRLKQHLAGERGNVAPCEEVPEEVKVQIQQHLGFKVLEKLKKQKGLKHCKKSASYMQCREEEDDHDDNDDVVRIQKTSLTQGSGKRRGKEVVEGISSRAKRQKKQCFPTATPIVTQPLFQSFASQEIIDQADMAVARFMYEAGIPFTAANSHYFQEMADAIATVGPGYRMPSYHSLRGKLLNRSVQDDQLHQIFTGATWMQSAFSKQRAGLEVSEIIVDEHFWSLCDQTAKVTKPLLSVLHLLDEPNITAQVTITSNIKFYEEAAGDFGRPVALRGRESLAPATWWSLYAADYPDLQRLAVRILSQTCNIIRCDRSWSMFERTHSKKKNRLEHQRLNDLLFVHYNLHLQQRRSETSKTRYSRGMLDPICLEATDANMVDWLDDPGVNDNEDLSWMDVTIPCEKTLPSNSAKSTDDSNDSTDDRGSDDARGMDENDDS
ncbi:hypothetical protein FEM48_Zijuj03G0025200 [Ziziphus jujuba var. spinosa]|uniref:BED-type domain-containing protein n=1 Tax=Ziziphus jujuba var. spinosa TaxID=714518 RepID=A0A978VMM8_ZIZJJ|nr:hypothetical protein FEM48_Zijuj03G0025200 [Ziziphus jujuba var. spinosa]